MCGTSVLGAVAAAALLFSCASVRQPSGFLPSTVPPAANPQPSPTTNPAPSLPTPPVSPSPAPEPVPAGSGESCGQKNSYGGEHITGRVLDAETAQPIIGSIFIAVDFLDDGRPLAILMSTNSDGSFVTPNLPGFFRYNYAVTFSALYSAGVPYRTKILLPTVQCPITTQIDIGTVTLTRGSGASFTVLATTKGSDSRPALVDIVSRLSIAANGVSWNIGWPFGMPRTTLTSDATCPQD